MAHPRWILLFILVIMSWLATGHASPPLPERAQWEQQMVQAGQQYCQAFAATPSLADTYYDAGRVYYQLWDYTRDPAWKPCAEQAIKVYRQYVMANQGRIPGYWVFPHGLVRHYQETGDQQSRDALLLLAQYADYAASGNTKPADRSREVAYNLQLMLLLTQELGVDKTQRLQVLVEHALGHLQQWFTPPAGTTPLIRPFMVALTSEALIRYYMATGDPRVLPALQGAWNWIWTHLWIPDAQAFQYGNIATSTGGTGPTPDLNLLIVPVFGWLYQQTGNVTYRERGDQIFASGVIHDYLGSAKHFHQQYRWSFDYVQWRTPFLPPMPPERLRVE